MPGGDPSYSGHSCPNESPDVLIEQRKMSLLNSVTFAVAVNNRKVFNNNFLASPCLVAPHSHQIFVQENFSSAAKAYNDAIDKCANDLIIFCHQDILLPETWFPQLENALQYLEEHDPNWGAIGTYGKTQDGRGWGHVYSSGRDVIGEPLEYPVRVQTLDEIVLILRKSSGLRFDDSLPHFHFYGADICLKAASKGMNSYAISAFCIHNTHQYLVLPNEFYEAGEHLKRTWKRYLPIQTTCVRLTKLNLSLYRRRIGELYLKHFRHREIGGTRLENPALLLSNLRSLLSTLQGNPDRHT